MHEVATIKESVWSGVGSRNAWIDSRCEIHAEEPHIDLRWNNKTGKLEQRWWVGKPGGDNYFEWREIPFVDPN